MAGEELTGVPAWQTREVDVTAQNQFCDPINIRGTGVATVTSAGAGTTLSLQIEASSGVWSTLQEFSGAAVDQWTFEVFGNVRIGCETGNFGAACSVRLERD